MKMPKNLSFPIRLGIGICVLFCCTVSFMYRTGFNLVLSEMTRNSTEEGQKFEWDSAMETQLVGAFSIGYFITNLIGGVLCKQFGSFPIISLVMVLGTALYALSPVVADLGYWYLYGHRIVQGLVEGPLYSGIIEVLVQWSPPNERSKFMASFSGGNLGGILGNAFLGVVISEMGWQWGFYIPGVIGGIFVLFWLYNVRSAPKDHPRIKPKEQQYIETSIGNVLSKEKEPFPIWDVLKSGPFWALQILNYGAFHSNIFLNNSMPKYYGNVLGFDIKTSGLICSIPSIIRIFSGFCFGAISDYVRKRNLMDLTTSRKAYCILSHVIPGLLLAFQCHVDNSNLTVVMIITAQILFGAMILTNLQNNQDLSPNHASQIFSFMNAFSNTSGFLTQFILGEFLKDGDHVDNWNKMFAINAAVTVASAVYFWFFGTTDVQKWNSKKSIEEEKVEDKKEEEIEEKKEEEKKEEEKKEVKYATSESTVL